MLRRLLLLALMLILVIVALPFSVAQADCDFSYSNYARAVQLHDMGDYGPALAHYQCALLEDPDDAILPLLIENVYEDIANAPSAWSGQESETSATACEPALDHARLGADAHDAGYFERALSHLQCQLLEEPQHINALHRLAQIHLQLGDSHSALYYFNRIAQVPAAPGPEADDLLTVLLGADARSVLDEDGRSRLRLTSPQPAETGEYLPPGAKNLKRAPLVNWARRHDHDSEAGKGGDFRSPEPSAELERALEIDPTRVDLRCELGRLYKARGDYAAAYRQFTALIMETLGDHCRQSVAEPRLAPSATLPVGENASAKPVDVSPAAAEFAAGLRHLEQGRLFAAANTFLQALELAPQHLDARCQLGQIYTEWAHYRGALAEFDFILQQEPQNNCARQNRTIAARDMLAIFTPLVVDDYFYYARTYVRMEEWELARDAFLQGLAIDPLRYDARCELGMLYAQLGDDRAALAEFDLALFADDMDACARSNRHALLQRLRDG